jgi:hypothetical protein
VLCTIHFIQDTLPSERTQAFSLSLLTRRFSSRR